MKSHFSASDLAGVADLPKNARHVRRLATKRGWKFTEAITRGGKQRLYLAASLPDHVREAIATVLIKSAPASPTPATTAHLPSSKESRASLVAPAEAAPAAVHLATWQRDVATARKAIVDEVKRLGAIEGTDRAIERVIRLAAAGDLPEHLQGLVSAANARRGRAGKRTLSRRSIYRWMRDAGRGFVSLAPAAAKVAAIPPWAPTLLKLYQTPQGKNLSYCITELPKHLQPDVGAPSYHQARRFLERMGNVERQRGRMGPNALRSIRPYVKRDTSHMWPTDCYTTDGHTFDAETAHPAHRRPFRPEVTATLDVATRRAVGFSVALAESTWAVLDSLRDAILRGGICALWYVDRGAAYKSSAMVDQVTGFAARLGVTITHNRPQNAQGHGLSEKSHQSLWVRAAKQLPTYIGASMDREAKQKVFKIVRRDIKAVGTSPLLMPWRDFIAFCQLQVDEYNARPHRSLPKIRDAATGKMRHQSPDEAWQQAIDQGWEPVTVAKGEADDLFRPYKLCRVSRGLVQLFGNSYFSGALEEHHGDQVQVGYEIRDASRVWVRDLQGCLICVAEFEGNKRAYFAQPVIEQAAAKRAQGRIARAQARIDEATEELQPPAVLEHQSAEPLLAAAQLQAGNVVALPTSERGRPMFDTDAEKFRWLMEHRDEIDGDDERWIAWYRGTTEWEDIFAGPTAAAG